MRASLARHFAAARGLPVCYLHCMQRGVWAFLAGALLACGGTVSGPTDGGPDAGTPWNGTPLKEGSADKVDLLFAIDNSASMGDKQSLLAAAVPTLIGRLLNPDCVDQTTGAHVPGDNLGPSQCASIPNTKPEFAPVHDLHVGIVSSSLGGGGSPDVCVPSGNDTTHQDDHGHLLNRTWGGTTEGSIQNAKPLDGSGGNFLAWLPSSDPKNAGKADPNVTKYNDGQQDQLITDFQSLVTGVQQHGCGLEAQLESWYRFLIQPDPWDAIQMNGGNPPTAMLSGVDATLLKMRHDFLRPDSVVAVIQVTDEEDSWSDPLYAGGFGWAVRTNAFPGGPGQGAGPRGTSECDQPVDVNNPANTGPNNPDCTSCAFAGNKPVSGQPVAADVNCTSCAPGASTCPQNGWYSPASVSVPIAAADGLNVRYGEQYMKPRYGLDPQFPIQRYVDGLTSPTVPDRDNESHTWPQWTPTKNCTNPLFAEDLPDGSDTSPSAICALQPGPRTPDMVFYAVVGGVPNSIVDDANGNLKLDLSAADWTKIVGQDPDHFLFQGIDPHMIESDAPRSGLQAPGSTYGLGNDPDNGREWNTLTSPAAIDLQYACTFDLPVPKDCTSAANANACDCIGASASSPDGPPLCDVANRNMQVKGKAYPTIRELRVAEGLGPQSLVASLCAKVVTGSTSDPGYGYNPAMNAIVDRLRPALANACLPAALPRNSDGTVPCDVYVVYPNQTDQAAGCTDPGMSQPSPAALASFAAQYSGSGPPPVLCQFKQLAFGTDYTGSSCETGPSIGWCYVENTPDGCAQAIAFGGGGPPPGTTVELVCTTP
jgi:hypothetical protein